MKPLCHPNILQKIYTVHVYSRLNYCLLVWGTLISQAESKKFEIFPNASIRVLTNGRLRQPTLSMYKAFKSIRFVERVRLSLVLFMYKNCLLPVSIRNVFLQCPNRPKTQNNRIPGPSTI